MIIQSKREVFKLRYRPFVKLTVWSLAGLILFGLLELFFALTVSVVDPYGGGAGGSGPLIAILNFIFITLIILSVIGLLIGIGGLVYYYFLYEEDDRDYF